MLSREDLYHRIIMLVPNGQFSLWPDDGREENYSDDAQYFRIDGWCICWSGHESNVDSFPSEEAIKSITKDKVKDFVQTRRKYYRDETKKQDLTMVACYQAAKQSDPSLSFSAYLDSLEAAAQSIT